MRFQERLRELRQKNNLSQVELGKMIGVSDRTIQNYENNRRTPQTYDIIYKLAAALGVKAEELVGEEEMMLVEASERGGAKAARDISQLVGEVTAMFAGGELTDEDKDAAMRALNDAYWESRQINKKYTPKKYRQ